MVCVRLPASTRAACRGTKFNLLMAALTRFAVLSSTGVVPFNTRLTVAIETFACCATCEMVGAFLRRIMAL